MTITRTAKGTAIDKTGALTLTIANVAVTRRLLVVGISYDVGQGAPVIKWGNILLKPIITVSGNGIVTRIVAHKRRKDSATKDIVATWTTTAPTAKAMFASTFEDVNSKDITSGLAQNNTGSPNSGTSQTTNIADEVFVGAMGSEGPSEDTVGTPSNSYTAGQRAGTTGTPAGSNITIQEIYKIVSATESTQAAKTGASSRDHSSVLATFKETNPFRFNIQNYDQFIADDIADVNSLDRDKIVMRYNDVEDQMEMWEVDLESVGTLKATRKDNADWVEV